VGLFASSLAGTAAIRTTVVEARIAAEWAVAAAAEALTCCRIGRGLRRGEHCLMELEAS